MPLARKRSKHNRNEELGTLYLKTPSLPVVQYRALQGGWKEKKLSGNDKLSRLGGGHTCE